MNVLVVGSGGREHALAWKLAQSDGLDELHAAPGNPGIASVARCHPVAAEDGDALLALCQELEIDLAVFGPEAPLVHGVAEAIRHAGVPVVGPSAAAARIEGSKSFAKDVMRAAGVPTAAELSGPRAPCVVKADGLAAGKGVFVCRSQREADGAWERARSFGSGVVVEELLEGEELSVFALTDGSDVVPLPPARDAKRLLDGDEGPNTGGMGAYSPVPYLVDDEAGALVERIHRPVIAELVRREAPFVGLLYAGLMLTDDGPRVLEFNCRFGDPETQAVLPRLDGDFLELLELTATGGLASAPAPSFSGAAVGIVLASPGYPDAPETGIELTGLDEAQANALVFHAGTALREGRLVAAGGRALTVTGVAETVDDARERAYRAVDAIGFPGAQYRRDIALQAVHVAG
jgi:phosphoribosylamine---glycine ligase